MKITKINNAVSSTILEFELTHEEIQYLKKVAIESNLNGIESGEDEDGLTFECPIWDTDSYRVLTKIGKEILKDVINRNID